MRVAVLAKICFDIFDKANEASMFAVSQSFVYLSRLKMKLVMERHVTSTVQRPTRLLMFQMLGGKLLTHHLDEG